MRIYMSDVEVYSKNKIGKKILVTKWRVDVV